MEKVFGAFLMLLGIGFIIAGIVSGLGLFFSPETIQYSTRYVVVSHFGKFIVCVIDVFGGALIAGIGRSLIEV